MADDKNEVLLVTRHNGLYHILPDMKRNRRYFEQQNKINKLQKYKVQPMTQKEADKIVADNNGHDKDYVIYQNSGKVIAALQENKSVLEKQIADLQAQLAEATNAKGDAGDKLNAAELVQKIKEAWTEDEVNALVTKDEKRSTVLTAREQQLQMINKK